MSNEAAISEGMCHLNLFYLQDEGTEKLFLESSRISYVFKGESSSIREMELSGEVTTDYTEWFVESGKLYHFAHLPGRRWARGFNPSYNFNE